MKSRWVLLTKPSRLIAQSSPPATQLRRALSIFNLRRSDHVTSTLECLQWLCVPERIRFKVAVKVYRALNGTAPAHLTACFTLVSSAPRCRGLRSADIDRLVIPKGASCRWGYHVEQPSDGHHVKSYPIYIPLPS